MGGTDIPHGSAEGGELADVLSALLFREPDTDNPIGPERNTLGQQSPERGIPGLPELSDLVIEADALENGRRPPAVVAQFGSMGDDAVPFDPFALGVTLGAPAVVSMRSRGGHIRPTNIADSSEPE